MKQLDWNQLERELANVGDDVEKAVLEGRKEVGARILADARERAPEVTGNLKRSARQRVEGNDVIDEFTADYAATVHEDPNSRGSKFLEDAVKDASKTYADDVAEAARKHMRGGRG